MPRVRTWTRFVPQSRCVRFALAVLSVFCASPAIAQSSSCRAPDTSDVPRRTAYLALLASSTDPQFAGLRSDLGLPSANPSKVALVTRTTSCRSASDALNVAKQQPGAVRQVWLFSLGTWFAVVDPLLQAGPEGISPVFVLNPKFVYKGTLVVP
jgi:hypothetical protein